MFVKYASIHLSIRISLYQTFPTGGLPQYIDMNLSVEPTLIGSAYVSRDADSERLYVHTTFRIKVHFSLLIRISCQKLFSKIENTKGCSSSHIHDKNSVKNNFHI